MSQQNVTVGFSSQTRCVMRLTQGQRFGLIAVANKTEKCIWQWSVCLFQGGVVWGFPLLAGRRVGDWTGGHCGYFMCQIWIHWWALVYCFCLMITNLLYTCLFMYMWRSAFHAFRCPFVPWRWTGGEACCVHSLSCATMAEQWWRNPRPLLHRQWVSHLCAAVCLFMRKKKFPSHLFSVFFMR